MPAISVILPVYNGEAFLDEAIASVCAQDFDDFELLIGDDGSTDATPLLLSKWQSKDRRIRVYSHKNQGIVATLNNLVKHAQGNLIARMDADDICMPERLSKQFDYFQQDPDLAVLGAKVQLFGAQSGCWHYRQSVEQTRALLLLGNTPLCHPSIMVRRTVYQALPYRSTYPHMEDLDWFMRVATELDLPMHATEEVLMGYRIHTDNISIRHKDLQREQRKKLLGKYWRNHGIRFSEQDLTCFVEPLMGVKTSLSLKQQRDSVAKMAPQLEKINAEVSEELRRRTLRWTINELG